MGHSKLDHSVVSAQEAKRKSRLEVSPRSDNAALPKRRKGIYVPLVPFILRSSEIMNSFLFGHGAPNLVTLAGGIVSSRALNGKFGFVLILPNVVELRGHEQDCVIRRNT